MMIAQFPNNRAQPSPPQFLRHFFIATFNANGLSTKISKGKVDLSDGYARIITRTSSRPKLSVICTQEPHVKDAFALSEMTKFFK